MEYIISATEAMLLDVLTPEQVEEYITNNPSKAEAINKAIEANAKAKALDQARVDFIDLLDTIELPDPPEGVLNIYRPYRKATRPLTKAEKDEVKASNPNIEQAMLDARVIDTGEWTWGEWQFNKSMATTSAKSGESKARTRKLAVTVNKRDGNTLALVGNFRTSKEACEHFGLETKGDSARRVLEANKYIVDDYDGDQFLVSEK